jgi:membrane-associated protease RseP (regulator of RpoE activity)
VTPEITVFVRAGDPQSEALLRYLDQRALAYTTRDVTADPSASAILFGRLGRIAVPALAVDDRMIVGFDPVQLARFLPHDDGGAGVSLGATVRSVTRETARERGLAAAFGVEVGAVHDDSPAAVAGLRSGDVITAIGGYTLTGGADQFRTAVAARRPGDSMTITVWREGASTELGVQFPRTAAEPTDEEHDPEPAPEPVSDSQPEPG